MLLKLPQTRNFFFRSRQQCHIKEECNVENSHSKQLHRHNESQKPCPIRHFWCQIRDQHHKLPHKRVICFLYYDKTQILLSSDRMLLNEKYCCSMQNVQGVFDEGICITAMRDQRQVCHTSRFSARSIPSTSHIITHLLLHTVVQRIND